jgi:hypothetical protein
MPFEWTGNHQQSAAPPQALCLPLKGSVVRALTFLDSNDYG